MIKYIIGVLLIAVTINVQPATANFKGRDRDTVIHQAEVDRIIKTLAADDMQGRASFTAGIEKAAQFIEHEFKQIGLKPLKGNKNYRQNFNIDKLIPAKTIASINGKTIATDSVFTITSLPALNWNSNADVTIEKLEAGMDFTKAYAGYIAAKKKLLVLIDPSFSATFKRIWGRNTRNRYQLTASDGSVVFVSGKFNKVTSFNISYGAQQQPATLFNIAGMIKGKSKKKEYVIFSAHYDHLGIIKPMDGDSIANGADDDASGTTAVIELARYYKNLRHNQRTLIFVAFTAEEIGEFGSQYFATRVNPDAVAAMFNIEMIGKVSKFGQNSAFITGYERSDFGEILQSNLKNTPFKFYPDPYLQQNLFYRSDNASLAKMGVPAHSISTDQIDVDKLYHSVKDEYSTVDISNITATIQAIALSSRTIVSGEDTPKQIEKQK